MDPKTHSADGMSRTESRAALSLAGIFSLRMLGLFLILPVFALYAEHLEGVTPILVGAAIGAYGLTQALLQIPFGMLSDRIGRKPVIVAGLLLFAVGSIVAANSETIWGVILGRAIQGSGAIAAAVMALAADLTREQNRTKAMGMIGISIGMAFAVAMVLGPLLDQWVGVPGLFWLTAVLALGGIGIVLFLVPNPADSSFHRDAGTVPGQFGRVLRNPDLLRLDFGIFVLHMILTAVFLAVPLALRDLAGLPSARHWLVYLPVMVLAMGLMVPFIVIAEKRRKMKSIFVGAVLTIALAQTALAFWHASWVSLAVLLLVYFTAFNVLEASLPSLISKTAEADSKGTAMGVYSSSQFFGAFLGGLAGGWMHATFDLQGVFLFAAAAAGLWFLVALGMAPPRYLSSYLRKVGEVTESQAHELQAMLLELDGVEDAAVAAGEGVAYLKIDRQRIDEQRLDEFFQRQG